MIFDNPNYNLAFSVALIVCGIVILIHPQILNYVIAIGLLAGGIWGLAKSR
jgi:hypothetical protein